MLTPEVIAAQLGRDVAKMFPSHSDEPFAGKVDQVDTSMEDDKPFHIVYDDGDDEWVGWQELQRILVKRSAAAPAGEAAQGAAAQPKGRAARATMAAQSGGAVQRGRKHGRSQDPAGEGGCAPPSKQRKAAQVAAQPGAAAAGAGGTAADTSAQAAAAGAAPKGKAAAGAAPAPPGSPAVDLDGLLSSINATAAPTARRLSDDRAVARQPHKGPGSDLLPAMSQAVVVGSQCYVTIYSAGAAPSLLRPAGQPADYKAEAEAEAVLASLEQLLASTGSSKGLLLKVTVVLRSMSDGLAPFKLAWNSWVDRASLPVVTMIEGAGPWSRCNIVLEATALVAA